MVLIVFKKTGGGVDFYEAANLHLTHDLCSLKGGSGVHVSRPQSPGLNKDQGFSLLQLSEEVSKTLHFTHTLFFQLVYFDIMDELLGCWCDTHLWTLIQ